MYEFVEAMIAVVTAMNWGLILHVRFPCESGGLEPVDQIDLGETVGATAACAAVECGGHYADVVGLARAG